MNRYLRVALLVEYIAQIDPSRDYEDVVVAAYKEDAEALYRECLSQIPLAADDEAAAITAHLAGLCYLEMKQ